MTDRMKRILFIVGFILSVFVIGFLLYIAFFRSAPVIQPTEQEILDEQTKNGFPTSKDGTQRTIENESTAVTGLTQADEIAKGGVTQTIELTTSAIFNPTLSGDGTRVQFYDEKEEKFYAINASGEIVSLSDKKFPSVEKATWDKTAEKAVLEFPDGSNIIYDFSTEKQVTLPKHWEGFDFSPVGDELAAKSIAIDPDNRWIVLSNADGTNVKSIQALGENADKVTVNWSPNDQVVGFSDTADGTGSLDRKIMIPLGKNQENFKGLTVEGLHFSSSWAPDGKQLLYSVSGSYSNYRPLLWTVEATSSSMGKNRKSLGLNTWVEKCTWSNQTTAYCAVPQNLPENAGLQPVVFENLPDSLYKIDLTTGTSSLVAIPSERKSMKQLFVTKDESALYFTNVQTGKLEFLKLK